MDFLNDWIEGVLRDWLVGGVMANLGGLFDNVNEQVGDIANTVGQTPGAFNPGVFALIQNLSETVVLPIAGIILTFVTTYELISLIIEKNNMHEIDTWIFAKWMMKTFVAVMILSNTWNIVMAVFDAAQSVVNSAGSLISGSTDMTTDMLADFEAQLEAMEIGPLIGLWFQSWLVQFITLVLDVVIFVIVQGRMVEIFLYTSLAPIPFATLSNREYGGMGQNYLKSLCAVAFQGLLIMVCVAIYAVMVQTIGTGGDPINAIWRCIGFTVLLAFTLLKTGNLSKSIWNAH
jgi:hypothetical protein